MPRFGHSNTACACVEWEGSDFLKMIGLPQATAISFGILERADDFIPRFFRLRIDFMGRFRARDRNTELNVTPEALNAGINDRYDDDTSEKSYSMWGLCQVRTAPFTTKLIKLAG